MAIISMTGFAESGGSEGPASWRWEARSVNARGLDLRFRLADGADSLEPELRRRAAAALSRGAATFALRCESAAPAGPVLDAAALEGAVRAVGQAAAVAHAAGLSVAPVAPDRLLTVRGVLVDAPRAVLPSQPALLAGFDAVLDALRAARAAEGRELALALTAILDRIDALVARAEAAHAAQTADAPARLREKVAALLDGGAGVAPERLAAELALLAVRADVSEEIDRLRAHGVAARRLLSQAGPSGRELDFLTQEFNREANTLCAKSASAALTDVGLALKVQIDRLREQAQNIE